ncbi:hypothetical protein NMG60_11023611 [Bertholletia excelsa]
MGKAMTWIRSLLAGKREEKEEKKKKKKKGGYFSADLAIIPATATPKDKPRWSFNRSTSAAENSKPQKSGRSFDSIVTSQHVTKALLEYENEWGRCLTAAPPPSREVSISFARRALHALKGLVKLQALVRGCLVRKQTTATMQCMHALIKIQVRARIQRVQMAEASSHHPRTQSPVLLRQLLHDNHYQTPYSDTRDTVMSRRGTELKSRSGPLDTQQIEVMRQRLLKHYSGNLSISKREQQSQTCSPLASSDMSFRTHNSQFDQFSSLTTFHSPSTMAKSETRSFTFTGDFVDQQWHPWLPNYMTNTESSKAKVRSHSEPKQRPKSSMMQKARRSTSSNQVDIAQQALHIRRSEKPWPLENYIGSFSMRYESACNKFWTT